MARQLSGIYQQATYGNCRVSINENDVLASRKIIMATRSKVSEVGILVPVKGGSVPAMRSRTSYPGVVHS